MKNEKSVYFPERGINYLSQSVEDNLYLLFLLGYYAK
jgi:hypothetical protein